MIKKNQLKPDVFLTRTVTRAACRFYNCYTKVDNTFLLFTESEILGMVQTKVFVNLPSSNKKSVPKFNSPT